MPIFFGIILLFLFILMIKKDGKISINYSHYLSIFSFIFILQLIGSFFSERIDFQTTYVLIFCFITLMMFLLIEYLRLQKLYKYFLYILIFFIGIAVLLFSYIKYKEIIASIEIGSLYGAFDTNQSILNQAPPRITGFSRMVAILSLFVIFLIEYCVKKNTIFLIIINTFLGILVWLSQSRGTILSYYLSILTIIFILNFENNWLKKIKNIFLYIFGPIIISFIIYLPWSLETSLETKNYLKNNRIISSSAGSSGRITLWKISINSYDKIKLFGYGPQADRLVLDNYYYKTLGLHNPFSNNVSNGLIYTFLSGGYLAVILFFCLYIKNLFLAWNFLKTIKSNKKIDTTSKFSFILIVYFTIRSLVENSYAIWSLDFLLMLISMSVLNQFLANKKNHENNNNNRLPK